MAVFYTLQIKEVIKETANAISLIFDIPKHLKDVFSFKAGQYITLKKMVDGTELRRAYSLCSSPKSNQIKVTIKAVKSGTFSVFATSNLQEGDEIEVATPEGKFILEPKANNNYLGVAAGSGITPILSMVKAVLEEESSATFTLIYGNKSVQDAIFYNELLQLQETYPQFNLHFVFSREQQENALFGRIDTGNINYFIKNKYKDVVFNDAYLCGPEEMIYLVSDALQKQHIGKENIHFELFTASKTKEENATITDGSSNITIVLDEEEVSFSIDAKDDILSASLRNKIDAPYSCQGGVCSSCLAKVTKGKAIMTKNSILTKEEVAEGYILTCQAYPTTAKITVDFDDV